MRKGPEKRTDDLEEIINTQEPEEELAGKWSCKELIKNQQQHIAELQTLTSAVSLLQRKMNSFERKIKNSKSTTDALASLSDQNRKLNEGYFEREVLDPCRQTLISITDRCRDQNTRLQRYLEDDSIKPSARKAFLFLLKSRCSDITEIHGALSRLAIEPFTEESDVFDSSSQKIIQRVETDNPQLEGRISDRHQPGYIRNGKIIRREFVSVYYLK